MKVKFIEDEFYPYFSTANGRHFDIEIEVPEEWYRRFIIIQKELEVMQGQLRDMRDAQEDLP